MSPEARRTILLEVAAGRLTPEEAASRLEALRRVQPAGTAGTAGPIPDVPGDVAGQASDAGSPPGDGAGDVGGTAAHRAGAVPLADVDADARAGGGGAATGTRQVTAVRVEATAGRLHVTGDPEVAGVAVDEGEHTVRHEGGTLVVERTLPIDEEGVGGFVLDLKRGRRRRISFGKGDWRDELPLVVRVNPDLPLEVQLNAGSFAVRGVHAPLRCEVNAGTGRIEGFRGPLRAAVNAGSLSASGRLDHGESHVTCDAGSVRLELDRDSSVEVTVAATLGKVNVDLPESGTHRTVSIGSDERHFTMGDGTGSLDVRVNLGKVQIGTA